MITDNVSWFRSKKYFSSAANQPRKMRLRDWLLSNHVPNSSRNPAVESSKIDSSPTKTCVPCLAKFSGGIGVAIWTGGHKRRQEISFSIHQHQLDRAEPIAAIEANKAVGFWHRPMTAAHRIATEGVTTAITSATIDLQTGIKNAFVQNVLVWQDRLWKSMCSRGSRPLQPHGRSLALE